MKRFKWLALPYLVWLIFLVVCPIILMIVLSFTSSTGVDFSNASFSLDAFKRLADPSILKSLYNSIEVAFWTVVICLLLGYPTAYFISFSHLKHKMLFLLLLILPMWSNSMLRIVSWLRLFKLDWFQSFNLLGSKAAVIFVTVTTYLPFMIFPIYTILEKMDRGLIEASKDLGVPAVKTFFKVTLPLSMSGVCSGTLMVFLPAATGFAISEVIGNGTISMIGNLIQSVFADNDYNFGSLLSIFVSIAIIIIIILFNTLSNRQKKEVQA